MRSHTLGDGRILGSRPALVASLLAAALVAWIVTVQRMRGMDAGPGTDLGALGWYIGIWMTMMAAMMLPSTAPSVVMFSRVRDGAHTWVFVLGYLLAWAGYGLAAYAVYRGIRASAPSFLAWDDRGPWVAGGALIAAGLYQLTPLKSGVPPPLPLAAPLSAPRPPRPARCSVDGRGTAATASAAASA